MPHSLPTILLERAGTEREWERERQRKRERERKVPSERRGLANNSVDDCYVDPLLVLIIEPYYGAII